MFFRPFGEFFFFRSGSPALKARAFCCSAQAAPHCLHSVFSLFVIFCLTFRSSHLANSAAKAALKKAAYAETHDEIQNAAGESDVVELF
jgi:hypothetical protein